ncbi:hypothetical protein GJ496_001939 [Pomphorhynchus laevis]|nr:hypothetical protein GJ496_001939 [Pomphorhynchus laevis]
MYKGICQQFVVDYKAYRHVVTNVLKPYLLTPDKTLPILSPTYLKPISVDPPPNSESLKKLITKLNRRVSSISEEYSIQSCLSKLSPSDYAVLRLSKSDFKIYLERRLVNFNAELIAYLQICLYRRKERLIDRAIRKFVRKIDGDKYHWKQIYGPSTINEVLKVFCTKRYHLNDVLSLLKLMHRFDIQPDITSLTAALICYGKQDHIDKQHVNSILDKISKNYSLSSIFDLHWLDTSCYTAIDRVLKIADIHLSGMDVIISPITKPFENKVDLSDKILRSISEQTSTNQNNTNKEVSYIENSFKSQLTAALLTNKDELRSNVTYGLSLIPLLDTFGTSSFVDVMLQVLRELINESSTYSPTQSTVAVKIGTYIHHQFLIAFKQKFGYKDKMMNVYKEFCLQTDASDFSKSISAIWRNSELTKHEIISTVSIMWPYQFLVKIGRHFLDMMVTTLTFKDAQSDNPIPALIQLVQVEDGITQYNIQVNPKLVDIYKQSTKSDSFQMYCMTIPSLCKPLPWICEHQGGYLLSQASLIRTPVILSENATAQKPYLNALNIVGSVSWKINVDILSDVTRIFLSGGDDKLDIPVSTDSYVNLSKTKKGIKGIKRSQAHQRKQRAEMFSLWCNENYKLSIAHYLRNRTFWFPHSLDFRGRAYAIPPHFNHLGNDVSRSLLLFARGKPLGKDGLRWLKIHFVNLTELKKTCSTEERLHFADEIIDEIFDSALKPFDGRRFWQSSDKPWQTLACAMEIVKAIQAPSHEKYISHFPIHQDGSCNVLQHYAVLGRDLVGAKMVNLIPSPRPNDVYLAVAELVEEERYRDECNGLQIACLLKNFVSRKVIKQTVMTTVYGVTEYGAKRQILKQLKEKDFDQKYIHEASAYLAKCTFNSIRKMFKSAREIQDWLTDSARLMCAITGQPIRWSTPLNFKVCQPYFKPKKDKQAAKLIWVVDGRKQSTAIPPNFIHSLDASHMMMTASRCYREGLDFVSVHDSYWTHACDVPHLGKICREEFVRLHERPILTGLAEQWKTFIKNECCSFRDANLNYNQKQILWLLDEKLNRLPELGQLDINEVLKSEYFFS